MKLGQTCRNSKQEGRCRRGEARARAETELAVWQNSILPFPPLRSSPLPSRHLSHAPRLSPPLPGPSQSLPRRGLFFSPRVLACRPALLGSVSPQRRWACGASDPRSPTLAFSVSALLLLGGGGGYGRTALTSAHRGGSGLHRSVQLSAFLFFPVCVRMIVCVEVGDVCEELPVRRAADSLVRGADSGVGWRQRAVR